MGLKVLSLFDGMSCGQIALRELGIEVDEYYASEIDKFCIAQTQLNFPNTIQLGDVRGIDAGRLPRIDLILAGSPCQGFSFAGKQLNFDDPRSALFFEFHRIAAQTTFYNPSVKWLLENVKMARKNENVIITQLGGLRPVVINSALVSAQNRVRLYWSNIRSKPDNLFGGSYTDIPQPEDRGLFLADILEEVVDEKYYLPDKVIRNLISHKERNEKNGSGFGMVVKTPKDKSITVRVGGKGMYDIVCVAMRGSPDEQEGKTSQRLEIRRDGKTNTITTVQKDNLILQRPRGKNRGSIFTEKAPAITSNAWEQNNLLSTYGGRLRRMTPTECARLQTIPDWYKWACSATQQYRMLGNGWTVEVIKHILSFLEI